MLQAQSSIMLQLNSVSTFPTSALTLNSKRFRPGKFRHQILSEDFLRHNADFILSGFQIYFSRWQRREISGPELCAAYILLFLQRQRPQDWWSGRRPAVSTDVQQGHYFPQE